MGNGPSSPSTSPPGSPGPNGSSLSNGSQGPNGRTLSTSDFSINSSTASLHAPFDSDDSDDDMWGSDASDDRMEEDEAPEDGDDGETTNDVMSTQSTGNASRDRNAAPRSLTSDAVSSRAGDFSESDSGNGRGSGASSNSSVSMGVPAIDHDASSISAQQISDQSQSSEREEVIVDDADLPAHIKCSVGTYGKVYQCICGKAFSTKQNIAYHKNCDGSSKEFKCEQCPKQFSVKCHLTAHIKQVHEAPSFVCDVCKKKFRRKARLNTHKRLHTGERPFACTECDMTFVSKDILRTHMQLHSSSAATYKCTVCDKAFLTAGYVKRHMRTHDESKVEVICNQCGEKFSGKRALVNHLLTAHPSQDGAPPRFLFCQHPKCGKILNSPDALTKHNELHNQYPGEGPPKPFVCTECGQAFTRKENVDRHSARVHQQQNDDDESSSNNEEEMNEAEA